MLGEECHLSNQTPRAYVVSSRVLFADLYMCLSPFSYGCMISIYLKKKEKYDGSLYHYPPSSCSIWPCAVIMLGHSGRSGRSLYWISLPIGLGFGLGFGLGGGLSGGLSVALSPGLSLGCGCNLGFGHS